MSVPPSSSLPWLVGLVLALAGAGTVHAHDAAGHAHAPARKPQPSAMGTPADPKDADRVVEIEALDAMRFVPASLAVREGEVVRFVIRNRGALAHEFVLGSAGDLRKHAAVMRSMPHMEHSGDGMVTLHAGEQKDVTWRFGKAGVVDFACLQPGHFETGMRGTVRVRGAAR